MSTQSRTIILTLLVWATPFFSLGQSTIQYATWKGGKLSFVDAKGEAVISQQFDDLLNGFTEVGIGVNLGSSYDEETGDTEPGKWGFIDPTGKQITAIEYDEIDNFHEGWASVRKDSLMNWVDGKGNYLRKEWVNLANPFSEGLASFRVAQSDKFGYLDATGKVVIEPQFDRAFPFEEGLAIVGVGDRFGYLRKDGSYAISPRYPGARPFEGEYAIVGLGSYFTEEEGRGLGLIDRAGREILARDYGSIVLDCEWGGYYQALPEGEEDASQLYGLFSFEDGILTPPIFMRVGKGQGNYLPMAIPQLTPDGEHLSFSELQLEGITRKFYGEILQAEEERATQLLNSDFWAELVAANDPEVSWMTRYVFGLIGPDGSFVLPPRYDVLSVTDQEELIVGQVESIYGDPAIGLIDMDGNELLPASYMSLQAIEEELLIARSEEGYWGIIDREGNEQLPFQYNEIAYLGEGYFAAIEEYEGASVLFTAGEPLVTLPQESRLGYDSDVIAGGIIVLDQAYEYYGVLDLKGSWILPMEYELIKLIGE